MKDVVAAVCHRWGESGIELLLVRTQGGKRWTFPKGHVEAGERPWHAAAREAQEEAGAEGDVSTTPLTRYLYPDTRGGRGESEVAAYLLAVTDQRPPEGKERHRQPTWVSPDEAVRLLAEGNREPRYADEHERVVREAVSALSQQASAG
jgi:8-oxo-dGTP pyrophosphatase MutT (NUDIX family)